MNNFDEVQDKLVARLQLLKEREEAIEKEKNRIALSANQADNAISKREQQLQEEYLKVRKEKQGELDELKKNLNSALGEIQDQTKQIEVDKKNGTFVKKWGESAEKLNDLVSGVDKLRSVAQIALTIAHPDASALEQVTRNIYDQQAAVELAAQEIRERADPKNQEKLQSATQAEVSPDTKKKEAEKMMDEYIKELRKEAVKSDTIDGAIKEADKNLLEKLNGKLPEGSTPDVEELKKQVKERYGDEVQKQFEERRREEIEKRRELEKQHESSLEISKQKERGKAM